MLDQSARRLSGAADRIGSVLKSRCRAFGRDESGTLVTWYLFTTVGMMMAVGLGLSIRIHELNRVTMQNTLDRAVLAATDLDQTINAVEVIEDYADRAGIGDALTDAQVTTGINYRRSTASAEMDMNTIFVPGGGVWDIKTASAAYESITDVEIVLVLDNSGSMGWDQGQTSGNGNYRLNLLKPAAKDFIDAVSRPILPGVPGSVAISIVPFSTQVNAGPILGAELDWTDQHNYSQCARFDSGDYDTTVIDPDSDLERAAHFDIWSWNTPPTTYDVICPFDSSRQITPWSQNSTALKAKIDSMWAGGNTSMDVATKWGAALLDPAFRPVLNRLEDAGVVEDNIRDQPFNYGRQNTLKVLVVMSDGENTKEYRLKDEYRSGNSPVYQDPQTGDYSYRVWWNGQHWFYSIDDENWSTSPDGGDDAVRLKWPELLNQMSVKHYAKHIKKKAIGGSWQDYRSEMYTYISPSTKNARTSDICEQVRDAGVVVYTIGMDTYGQGDTTLEDCAGSSTHFYDINALQISQAFSSIAAQINQLRLTH